MRIGNESVFCVFKGVFLSHKAKKFKKNQNKKSRISGFFLIETATCHEKIKIFMKKCLTFWEDKFIVYGLSKLGRQIGCEI